MPMLDPLAAHTWPPVVVGVDGAEWKIVVSKAHDPLPCAYQSCVTQENGSALVLIKSLVPSEALCVSLKHLDELHLETQKRKRIFFS